MNLQANTTLQGGRYTITKVLGQGSFGITYLAKQTNLDKTVAIKEFFMKELNSRCDDGSITGITDGSMAQDYARKFQKEAMNLSRLEHSNIVKVVDSFSENNTFYYVMDFIDGDNLNDYIKSHHVSEQEAVSIIEKVADALIYMHEGNNMLHLDLKPGNIMRRKSDGHIFLIDFGLSKHFSNDGQPETSTSIGLGTSGYAPIEQSSQAKNGEFRPTIDVYALGATLYKLLTRETPPPAAELVDEEDILINKLNQNGVSQHLKDVILHAMTIGAKKRTQSIRAFKDELLASTTAASNDDETMVFGPKAEAEESNEETIVTGGSAPKVQEEPKPKQPEAPKPEPTPKKKSKKWRLIVGAIVGLLIIYIVGLIIDVITCNSNANYNNYNPTAVDTTAVLEEVKEVYQPQNNSQQQTQKASKTSNMVQYAIEGDFEGKFPIEGYIQVSDNGDVKGQYHYVNNEKSKKDCLQMKLQGKIYDNGTIYLDDVNPQSTIVGNFSGQLTEEGFSGTYTYTYTETRTLRFSIRVYQMDNY